MLSHTPQMKTRITLATHRPPGSIIKDTEIQKLIKLVIKNCATYLRDENGDRFKDEAIEQKEHAAAQYIDDNYIGWYESTRDFADYIAEKQKPSKIQLFIENLVNIKHDAKREDIEDRLFYGTFSRYDALCESYGPSYAPKGVYVFRGHTLKEYQALN